MEGLVDSMTEEDVIRGFRNWRAKKDGAALPKWYHPRLGHPTFRRYYWAIMLGLSIATAMSECYQLWRALQDTEAGHR